MAENIAKQEEEYSYDDSLGVYVHPEPISIEDIEIDEEFYFHEQIEIGGVPARIDTRYDVLLDNVYVRIDEQKLDIHRVRPEVGIEGVMDGKSIRWYFDDSLDAFNAFLRRVDATVTNEDTDQRA
ncbi:hypothetical protein [Halorubrum sp. DTA98]|uniref:hypothetical protein n=1 Tax=Halorubrum sp. DTA98 TaxID=3402163 RepID=UPI003AAC8E45